MAQYETLGEKVRKILFTIFLSWVLLFVLGIGGKLMWRVFMLGWELV